MKTIYAEQQKVENILHDVHTSGIRLKNSGLHLLPKNNKAAAALPDQVKDLRDQAQNMLLSALSNQSLEKLAPFFERVSFAADEYLYRAGEPIKYLYFPETAIISEFRVGREGEIIETTMIGCEGLTGCSAFLANSPAGSWTQILVAGSMLRIKAGFFREIFDKSPELQMLVMAYLDHYVNQILQRSICHSYHSVEQRYCTWLLMISKRSVAAKLPLTQECIARSLGVNRPSVSIVAKNLQRAQIINSWRGSLSILNTTAIEKAACDCYRQIDSQQQH